MIARMTHYLSGEQFSGGHLSFGLIRANELPLTTLSSAFIPSLIFKAIRQECRHLYTKNIRKYSETRTFACEAVTCPVEKCVKYLANYLANMPAVLRTRSTCFLSRSICQLQLSGRKQKDYDR